MLISSQLSMKIEQGNLEKSVPGQAITVRLDVSTKM